MTSPSDTLPEEDLSMKSAMRERAMKHATRLCEIAFKDRTGHGNAPSSYRQMRPAELIALLIVAFEAGATLESNR